jgi:serine/threonine-protein kinase
MHERDYQPGAHIPGTVYRVRRLIGAGGMGTVYDVEDTTIGKRYVLKTLHPQLGAREDLARRMQNEARTLARLNHPNIVEVFTAGVTADDLRLPYYVMERLNGQSLRVILEKRGRLDLGHAYHIAIDLLDALDHAHDKGVIHRDVKPDNIFLHRTPAGITLTKLLDFGIVSLLDGGSHETAGRFLGTLRYAAPEQLRGEKATPKSDVYAAALVLYEVLAGRGPFDDEGDPIRISGAHLNKLPPSVSVFVPVPRELDTLLTAALAKNTEERPRDAFSFAASLRNLKTAHQALVALERTENRTTQSAIVPPSAPAAAKSESSLPGARTPEEAPSSSLSPPRPEGASLPRSTQPVGSFAATGTSAPASGTTTAQDSVDRGASTRSVVDAPLVSRKETEGFSIVPPAPGELAEALADTLPAMSIRWPDDLRATSSDSPQVRSLPTPPPTRSPWPLVGLLAAAAFLIVLAAAYLRGRSDVQAGPTPRDDERFVASAAPAVASPSPPLSTAPRDVVPAPTIAPPAFEEPSAQPQAAAVAPVLPRPAKSAAVASAPPRPRPASSGSARIVLPGPGF